MSTADLLTAKKRMNAKRPDFIRQYSWSSLKRRLGEKWRRPTGVHSKMRRKRKGNRVLVHPGYRTPLAVRGLLTNGLQPVHVFNDLDIDKLDGKKQAALVAASVGKRKRALIVSAAQKKGIILINIRDAATYHERMKKELEERKKARAARSTKKKEGKEAVKEVKEEKIKKEKDAGSEQEKKEKEEKRREAERVMITQT